ncbi:hypothetical protein WR25_17462 [Diploscapter pachys]|uniref:Uncharacterized protein n=1 Tax=Diploscapter pachys TaxID=2018661 RepID=A0A2A2M1L7_9BILA|nr:hypothetical protein WR25_17462 [Diploscapter pachys]
MGNQRTGLQVAHQFSQHLPLVLGDRRRHIPGAHAHALTLIAEGAQQLAVLVDLAGQVVHVAVGHREGQQRQGVERDQKTSPFAWWLADDQGVTLARQSVIDERERAGRPDCAGQLVTLLDVEAGVAIGQHQQAHRHIGLLRVITQRFHRRVAAAEQCQPGRHQRRLDQHLAITHHGEVGLGVQVTLQGQQEQSGGTEEQQRCRRNLALGIQLDHHLGLPFTSGTVLDLAEHAALAQVIAQLGAVLERIDHYRDRRQVILACLDARIGQGLGTCAAGQQQAGAEEQNLFHCGFSWGLQGRQPGGVAPGDHFIARLLVAMEEQARGKPEATRTEFADVVRLACFQVHGHKKLFPCPDGAVATVVAVPEELEVIELVVAGLEGHDEHAGLAGQRLLVGATHLFDVLRGVGHFGEPPPCRRAVLRATFAQEDALVGVGTIAAKGADAAYQVRYWTTSGRLQGLADQGGGFGGAAGE